MAKELEISKLGSALPFWVVLPTIPILAISAYLGGWWLLATLIYSWVLFGVLDAFEGLYEVNPDPDTGDEHLFLSLIHI